MSTTYKMSDIDDVREIVIDLDENGKALTGNKVPVSAILRINHNGVQKQRTLVIDGSAAKYRITDADLNEFGSNATLTARVHTTHADDSNGCFPTPPKYLTIVIGEADPPTLS